MSAATELSLQLMHCSLRVAACKAHVPCHQGHLCLWLSSSSSDLEEAGSVDMGRSLHITLTLRSEAGFPEAGGCNSLPSCLMGAEVV